MGFLFSSSQSDRHAEQKRCFTKDLHRKIKVNAYALIGAVRAQRNE